MLIANERNATPTDDSATQAAKPTGLKPVLDAIPAHCYERSTARGLLLLARDLVLYGAVVTGLLLTDTPWLLVPLWAASMLVVSALFVLGHDAAHDALFDSKRLNAFVARLSMLPSWHATELWIFGHNRVHHGHTLRQGMDFVWHPLTPQEYASLSRLGKLRHKLEWGPLGAGAYYTRVVWLEKMVRFTPPERWARPMRRDQAIVATFMFGTLAACIGFSDPLAGLWLWTKAFVIPFLLFNQSIGWVVHVHHIAPDIRWWPRREWNRFRGQVEGTTVFSGPPGWELFYHWIMVHLPHHVDMQIPCYRLNEAAEAIAEAFPNDVVHQKLGVRSYVANTRQCKLHDFETGRWYSYADAERELASASAN